MLWMRGMFETKHNRHKIAVTQLCFRLREFGVDIQTVAAFLPRTPLLSERRWNSGLSRLFFQIATISFSLIQLLLFTGH
jgi:hypothetical protein